MAPIARTRVARDGDELRHALIPYEVVGGVSFYSARGEDLIAYLRVAATPRTRRVLADLKTAAPRLGAVVRPRSSSAWRQAGSRHRPRCAR